MSINQLAEVYQTEMKTSITPQGDKCILANEGLAKILMAQTRGSYQRAVIRNLARNGYIVSYLAQGTELRGNARNYSGKYERSLTNLMNRIENVLPGRINLESGSVGSKGGFGYRLTDEV